MVCNPFILLKRKKGKSSERRERKKQRKRKEKEKHKKQQRTKKNKGKKVKRKEKNFHSLLSSLIRIDWFMSKTKKKRMIEKSQRNPTPILSRSVEGDTCMIFRPDL